MAGLKDFTTETKAYRSVVRKAVNYTVLLTDELVQTNGAYTMTLPVISTMQGTTNHRKVLVFENIHATANATISPGTGNTIGGKTSWSLKPGELITIRAQETDTDWVITSPYPTPSTLRIPVIFTMSLVSGTGNSVNLFGGDGAPTDMVIDDVMILNIDSTAGDVVLSNATGTVFSLAKNALYADAVTAGQPVAYAAVAKGVEIIGTVSAGNVRVKVFGTAQKMVE